MGSTRTNKPRKVANRTAKATTARSGATAKGFKFNLPISAATGKRLAMKAKKLGYDDPAIYLQKVIANDLRV